MIQFKVTLFVCFVLFCFLIMLKNKGYILVHGKICKLKKITGVDN